MVENKLNSFAYVFTSDKINEFSGISAVDKLNWLEEANRFINKALGIKKRALFDERFDIFSEKRRTSPKRRRTRPVSDL